MGLFNIRTKKQVDGPEAVIVSDLDAMVANPIAFRLHGKVHHLRPVTTKEFFAYSNALISLDRLKEDSKISDEEILDTYLRLIQAVCDTIDREDVRKMTHAQAGALIKLIIDHVTGRVHAPEPATEEEQKKN